MSDDSADQPSIDTLYREALAENAMLRRRLSGEDPITIEEVGESGRHVVATFHVPGRIEITSTKDHLLVFAYTGTQTDLDQDPDAVYDSDRVIEPDTPAPIRSPRLIAPSTAALLVKLSKGDRVLKRLLVEEIDRKRIEALEEVGLGEVDWSEMLVEADDVALLAGWMRDFGGFSEVQGHTHEGEVFLRVAHPQNPSLGGQVNLLRGSLWEVTAGRDDDYDRVCGYGGWGKRGAIDDGWQNQAIADLNHALAVASADATGRLPRHQQ